MKWLLTIVGWFLAVSFQLFIWESNIPFLNTLGLIITGVIFYNIPAFLKYKNIKEAEELLASHPFDSALSRSNSIIELRLFLSRLVDMNLCHKQIFTAYHMDLLVYKNEWAKLSEESKMKLKQIAERLRQLSFEKDGGGKSLQFSPFVDQQQLIIRGVDRDNFIDIISPTFSLTYSILSL